ncbi:MAG: hypothetical protein A3I68_08540 [Candidatus Melainabacteria bacterium RIFCSPLOWO2_02_FULL_35_15]|nr:MAG: hypothetical protein A3I68_08540 [Candidatus Melainabacteria bacterium RIFCSPLOWO2_02_FULL_35_15]
MPSQRIPTTIIGSLLLSKLLQDQKPSIIEQLSVIPKLAITPLSISVDARKQALGIGEPQADVPTIVVVDPKKE